MGRDWRDLIYETEQAMLHLRRVSHGLRGEPSIQHEIEDALAHCEAAWRLLADKRREAAR